jgi:hypothetical protein
MPSHNKSVETNRRPDLPVYAGQQFGSTSGASPSMSAAVAHLTVSRNYHPYVYEI